MKKLPLLKSQNHCSSTIWDVCAWGDSDAWESQSGSAMDMLLSYQKRPQHTPTRPQQYNSRRAPFRISFDQKSTVESEIQQITPAENEAHDSQWSTTCESPKHGNSDGHCVEPDQLKHQTREHKRQKPSLHASQQNHDVRPTATSWQNLVHTKAIGKAHTECFRLLEDAKRCCFVLFLAAASFADSGPTCALRFRSVVWSREMNWGIWPLVPAALRQPDVALRWSASDTKAPSNWSTPKCVPCIQHFHVQKISQKQFKAIYSTYK